MTRKPSNKNSAPQQTREFSNDPLVPGTSSKKRKIRRFYRDNTLVFYTIVVIALISVVTIILAIRGVMNSEQIEVEDQSIGFVIDDSIDFEEFQNFVLLKRFGEGGADAFQSIRVAGDIELGETSQRFHLVKKRPNQALLKVYLASGNSMTIGVNKSEIWQRLERMGEAPIIQSVTGVEAESYRVIGQFFTPFLDQMVNRGSELFSVALSDDLGFQTVKVEFQNQFKNCRSTIYLDTETFVELQRIDHLEDGQIGRVNFSDYQTHEGYRFPMITEYYQDDVLIQKLSLDGVSVNPGVINSLFERPE